MLRTTRTKLTVITLLLASLLAPLRVLAEDVAPAPTQRRVGVTSAVTVGVTALTIGTAIGAVNMASRNCNDRHRNDDVDDFGFGCFGAGLATLSVFGLAVLPVALTLGSYLPHHAMDGRGKWWAALAGTAAGMAAGVAVMSIPLAFSDSDAALLGGTIAGGLVAAMGPVLALELQHKRRVTLERRTSKRLVMPMASSLPNGGLWLGIAGRL